VKLSEIKRKLAKKKELLRMFQRRLENGRIVVIDDNNVELSRKEYVIREFSNNDRSRGEIAKELEISYQIVFSYTKGLQNSHHNENTNGRSIMIADVTRKQYVIDEFNKNRSRGEIAKELGISYQIVFSYTKGLQNSKTDERSERLSAKYEEFNKKHAK
jgi:predicted transcriptional regulator